MWQVTYSPRPLTLSQNHMDLHVWSNPRRSYIHTRIPSFIEIGSGGSEPLLYKPRDVLIINVIVCGTTCRITVAWRRAGLTWQRRHRWASSVDVCQQWRHGSIWSRSPRFQDHAVCRSSARSGILPSRTVSALRRCSRLYDVDISWDKFNLLCSIRPPLFTLSSLSLR